MAGMRHTDVHVTGGQGHTKAYRVHLYDYLIIATGISTYIITY